MIAVLNKYLGGDREMIEAYGWCVFVLASLAHILDDDIKRQGACVVRTEEDWIKIMNEMHNNPKPIEYADWFNHFKDALSKTGLLK